MSVERTDGVIVFNCDGKGCHRNFEGEQGDEFKQVWTEAKRHGWVNAIVRKDWRHYCPTCGKNL